VNGSANVAKVDLKCQLKANENWTWATSVTALFHIQFKK
jgi:hypothetical protein